MKKRCLFMIAVICLSMIFASAAIAQPIKLRYVDHNPETGLSAQNATIPLMQSIEVATDNQVKIELYFSETLVKTRDTWDALKNGIADMGWMVMSQWPGKVPMTDAFGLPGLAYNFPDEYAGAMWRAYEKYPEMQAEYLSGGIRPLLFFSTEPYMLATAKKQVKTLEDLKNLKMRVLGGNATTQMRVLGGVPVNIPMPENYISLEKGVIDGMGINAEAVCGFRLFEHLTYFTYAPLQVSYFTIAIGEKKWQSLPAEIQQQIMSKGGYEGSRAYAENFHGFFVSTLYETAEKAGHKLVPYILPEDEYQRWMEASQPVYEEYYKYVDKKGLTVPAKALVQDLLEGNL